MFERQSSGLCLQCGSEYAITYTTVFKKWFKKIKFCPYCGHKMEDAPQNALLEWEVESESKESK